MLHDICMICGTQTKFYFTKDYSNYSIGTFDFYTCPHCGFVYSKTLFTMPENEWEQLNFFTPSKWL